jgi:hypothetical protein
MQNLIHGEKVAKNFGYTCIVITITQWAKNRPIWSPCLATCAQKKISVSRSEKLFLSFRFFFAISEAEKNAEKI